MSRRKQFSNKRIIFYPVDLFLQTEAWAATADVTESKKKLIFQELLSFETTILAKKKQIPWMKSRASFIPRTPIELFLIFRELKFLNFFGSYF